MAVDIIKRFVKKDQGRLLRFLEERAGKMPRITLRHATEKLDERIRARFTRMKSSGTYQIFALLLGTFLAIQPAVAHVSEHHNLQGRGAALVPGSPGSDAADCPAIPPVPTRTSRDNEFYDAWQSVHEPYSARHSVGYHEEPSFGVGYLDVSNADAAYYDWMRNIVLPLWSEPHEEAFHGWIHSGRVHAIHGATSYALTGAGLVETSYEFASFIVHEALDGGWLRIRLKPGKDGEAWTHQCHLQIGPAKLAYKTWEFFLREHGNWLQFRSRVPHTLREKPDLDSPRITMIGLDHKLVLREIHGEWMFVTVEQPDRTCSSGPERDLRGSIHEGWVKWRDEEKGPWVWVYTRGC